MSTFRQSVRRLLPYLFVIAGVFEASAFAEIVTKPSECETKPNATAIKQPPSHGRDRPSNCCCPSVISINPDANSAKENSEIEERWEQRKSREIEHITTISDRTLEDVEKHTDFLKQLWTWTAMIGSLAMALLAACGFKSIQDLKQRVRDDVDEDRQAYKRVERDFQELKQQTTKDLEEDRQDYKRTQEELEKATQDYQSLKIQFQQFVQEAEANNIVLMFNFNAEALTNSAVALERKFRETGNENYKAQALEKFKSIVELFDEKVKKEKIENTMIEDSLGTYAYNLYGYALYHQDEITQALAAVKEALKFKESPTAVYNAASYAARLHLAPLSARYLQRAIELEDEYLTTWETDPDFDWVRSSPIFRTAMGIQ